MGHATNAPFFVQVHDANVNARAGPRCQRRYSSASGAFCAKMHSKVGPYVIVNSREQEMRYDSGHELSVSQVQEHVLLRLSRYLAYAACHMLTC